MKCLLVEPGYTAKYPNLALMKISSKLKQDGHNVTFVKGTKNQTLEEAWNGIKYDEIYITSLFTYEAPITIRTIKHYQKNHPHAKIYVGGILASLMPELIERETGIKPFVGYSKELDQIKPDYDLYKTDTKWDNFSFIFTTRGCVNRCPYCAVPKLEPDFWVNKDWKKTIDFRRTNISIQDNNLTAQPIEHFRDVTHFCQKFNLGVIIESGLDCRLLTQEHVRALQRVKILTRGLRLAFDHMGQDGYIQRAISLLFEHGITAHKIMVYVLFNFNDTPKEAEYRARQIVDLGVDIYPQQYTPLDKTTRKPTFIGKYWTKQLAHDFRGFYQLPGVYSKETFPEWAKRTERFEVLEEFNKYDFVSQPETNS